MRRRTALTLAALVLTLAAVVAIGLSQSSRSSTSAGRAPSAEELRTMLAGSPAPLARLHAQANAMLPARAFPTELARLKGFPVVVNKWASWCGPCRLEFPIFQDVSARLGKRVAFLGLNSKDVAGSGPARFLRGFPLSYPNVSDPSAKLADRLAIGVSWPTTAFYDRAGKQTYAHQGPYLRAADLEADIRRYTG